MNRKETKTKFYQIKFKKKVKILAKIARTEQCTTIQLINSYKQPGPFIEIKKQIRKDKRNQFWN